MNAKIQHKINQFKELASTQVSPDAVKSVTTIQQTDGLSMAIHSQKDADIFMAELKAIVSKK